MCVASNDVAECLVMSVAVTWDYSASWWCRCETHHSADLITNELSLHRLVRRLQTW